MTQTGLAGLGAAALATLIRNKEVSAAEVTEAHIRRIEEVNGRLNAVVVPLFDEARAAAVAADRALADGADVGPLHGVPVTIKESFHVKGTPTTAGLPRWAGHRADADGPLVQRLRQAGAIVLGKTNVPQLLLYLESDNPIYGRTNNPWADDRTPGGSTGGEGAIIAAGGSPLGLGGDIGGSIRVPAHFCGISGLKPTSHRLSMAGAADDAFLPGMDAIVAQPGPLARDVADLGLAMLVLVGSEPAVHDGSVPPVPWQAPEAVDWRSLRVGFFTDDGYLPASPAIRRAVTEAARALSGLGVSVEPFTPPDVMEVGRLFTGLLSADGAGWAKALLAGGAIDRRLQALLLATKLPGPVKSLAAGGLALAGQTHLAHILRAMGRRSAKQYMGLVTRLNAYRQQFLAAMDAQRLDVLLCPPLLTPAFPHGASEHINAHCTYAQLFNVLGMPAGVVAATTVRPGEESDRPVGRSLPERAAAQAERGSAGLPVGVQVAARHWREDHVLAVMAVLEQHFRAQPDYPRLPA